jgi:hypothetical protein
MPPRNGSKNGEGKKRKKQRSIKGSLIKGMSRRMPSELLYDSVFRRDLQEVMRGYAGIYALYHGDQLYYTGLTGNLFNRIRWHTKDRHKNKWDHFIIFRIQRVRYLRDIETLLHNLVDTHGNRVRGKVPRDADLNRVLRQRVREYKRRLRGYERALRN